MPTSQDRRGMAHSAAKKRLETQKCKEVSVVLRLHGQDQLASSEGPRQGVTQSICLIFSEDD